MSRYPDTDPDTVLSSDDHSLLTTSLAVDDAELPDAVWEHMLAVVVGDDPEDGDGEVDAATGSAERRRPTTPGRRPGRRRGRRRTPRTTPAIPADDPAPTTPRRTTTAARDGGWV